MRGIVRWFNNGIGWGRIRGESSKDYHAHFANIVTPGCGFRTLTSGEAVEFEVVHGKDGKIPEAVKIQRSFPIQLIDPNAPTERFEKIPWAIEVQIENDGEVTFPQIHDSHPRDHFESHIMAHYLGHPGSFEKHNSFSATMPWNEVNHDSTYGDVAVYATNEQGGLIHDRAKPDFRPGNYVVEIQVHENSVAVSAKKVSLRIQDSRNVEHPQDKGVWLVLETTYADLLDIPDYEDGIKAERDLKKKLEAAIPAEFEFPTADHRKFAKAIARGILAIRKNR